MTVVETTHRSLQFKLLTIAVALVSSSVAWLWPRPSKTDAQAKTSLILPRNDDEFQTSDSCRSCHPGQHASWHSTFHRTMTQLANEKSVLAPFDGRELKSRGRRYRVWKDGDEFWVEMADPDWEVQLLARGGDVDAIQDPPMIQRRIVMTTGSHHIQCYWIASRNGNELRQFPWQYHMESKRWIPSEDSTLNPPDSRRHFGHWNSSCLPCHTVGSNPGLNLQSGHLLSQVAELGISCEACHGPGNDHVQKHRNPLNRYRQHLADTTDETIVNPATVSHKLSTQICGQCHSTFLPIDLKDYMLNGKKYRAGDELSQSRHELNFKQPDPRMADDARDGFWRDGTARVGGREYLGMIESACYRSGTISCLSCHSMHESSPAGQLASSMGSDKACLQCHSSIADQLESHTHHAASSTGSRCYNCHMPHTSYALFKGIRSHRIDSPNALNSLATGRPNACNLCHLDKSLDWTSRHLNQWYGRPALNSEAIEVSRPASVNWLLSGDAAQRVIAAWHFGWKPAQEASTTGWMAPFVVEALDDPYSAVRFVAFRSLKSLPEYQGFEFDFIGSSAHRSKRQSDAMRIWEQRRQKVTIPSEVAPFFSQDRKLVREAVDLLVNKRDDRPVSISE